MPKNDRMSQELHRTPQKDLDLEVMGCVKSMKCRIRRKLSLRPMDGDCVWSAMMRSTGLGAHTLKQGRK